MNEILRLVDPVLLDGGLATELEQRGADLKGHLWSARLLIENPSLIRETHLAYYLAGADVGISASYQATLEGFSRLGLSSEDGTKMLRKSVEILKEARDQAWEQIQSEGNPMGRAHPIVAASVGSYGAFLADGSEYSGSYGLTVDQLKNFHRHRIQTLMDAKPDVLACETIPCAIEARALLQLLHEPDIKAHQVPAWISVSVRDEEHLNSGDSIQNLMQSNGASDVLISVGAIRTTPSELIDGIAIQTLEDESASDVLISVGVNCSAPRVCEEVLKSMRQRTSLQLVVYANKGEEWDGVNKVWLPGTATSDEEYCMFAQKWLEAGARMIGGCCRTGPGTIRMLREALITNHGEVTDWTK